MKGRSEQSPGITSKLADRMAGSLLSLCTSATCVGMESRSIRGIPGPQTIRNHTQAK